MRKPQRECLGCGEPTVGKKLCSDCQPVRTPSRKDLVSDSHEFGRLIGRWT